MKFVRVFYRLFIIAIVMQHTSFVKKQYKNARFYLLFIGYYKATYVVQLYIFIKTTTKKGGKSRLFVFIFVFISIFQSVKSVVVIKYSQRVFAAMRSNSSSGSRRKYIFYPNGFEFFSRRLNHLRRGIGKRYESH